jgi:hypothetical protein
MWTCTISDKIHGSAACAPASNKKLSGSLDRPLHLLLVWQIGMIKKEGWLVLIKTVITARDDQEGGKHRRGYLMR